MTELNYKHLLQACDIIIVSKDKNKLCKFLNNIFGSTIFPTFNIFLFLFDDLCADTSSFGVQNRKMFLYDGRVATVIAARYANLTYMQRNTIIENALQQAADKHSFVFKNIKKKSLSCTKFITQCFLDVGVVLFPDKSPETVTINDFLNCSLLEKIIINECQ